MAYISPTLKVLTEAARKSANALQREFSEIERLQGSKNYLNFVAGAYDKIEKNLIFELNKARPDFPVSKTLIPSKGKYFLITPVDGIENLSRGIGAFGICISLIDEKNNILASVVYNPIVDEMYFAEKGNGSYKEGFRNLERLRVSDRKDFKGSIIATSKSLKNEEASYRNFGSTSIECAYLAAGKIDAAVFYGVEIGSLVAGSLLVKEAGGYIYDLAQEDIRSEELNRIFVAENMMAVNSMLGQKLFDIAKK